ncbi:MAG TPA: diaminopimelate dehydrogenase [Bacillota bacterium]|nr:diaminopimelate dehydrogenase [Bacillota bacterium]HOR84952.1 diaminopimelate dehydrogenase [Bacillota bacterium]HPL54461.1 diaminopimelate dehydrogenase [Bacillota bacterium]
MEKIIRTGIVGYGNLGKGVELALKQNPDFELKAIFTRRDISSYSGDAKLAGISDVWDYKNDIDVIILCGGSANDLPVQGPMLSAGFNTVDSYDNHSKIPEYFSKVNEVALASNRVSLISVGWDPGLFSLNRLLAEAILPQGKNYTFWGKGVSQGHSDAIRRIKGVKKGIQYTVPVEKVVEKVRACENPDLCARDKHKRICYVVAEESEDLGRIKKEIISMPNYFADYDTEVYFISEEEMLKNHSKMPHGGFVIHTGTTGNYNKQRMEFSLTLESNPEFTSSILVAYARAVYRLSSEGKKGAFSVFDVPFSYLSPKTGEELRKALL